MVFLTIKKCIFMSLLKRNKTLLKIKTYLKQNTEIVTLKIIFLQRCYKNIRSSIIVYLAILQYADFQMFNCFYLINYQKVDSNLKSNWFGL